MAISTRSRSRRSVSRLDSGSSNSSRPGRATTARASATRCCWPPDSSLGYRPPSPARPTRSSASGRRRPSVRGQAAAAQREADVAGRGQVRPQGVVLEDHGQVALLRRQVQVVPAISFPSMEIRPSQPLDTGQARIKSRFARAGWPEQDEESAGLDPEIQRHEGRLSGRTWWREQCRPCPQGLLPMVAIPREVIERHPPIRRQPRVLIAGTRPAPARPPRRGGQATTVTVTNARVVVVVRAVIATETVGGWEGKAVARPATPKRSRPGSRSKPTPGPETAPGRTRTQPRQRRAPWTRPASLSDRGPGPSFPS